ncbi:MAG: diadenylate cyclase CdaA [Lachnospiraceae bacterium]|nr:diadenylate cyclase CdaA [Lachnospiraceae bacterium]
MNQIIRSIKEYLYGVSLPKVTLTDVLEIVIIAFALYHITFWVKRTRAWTLVKGVMVLLAAYVIAYFFNMTVILWVFDKTIGLGITALLIVFQPELRRALEELGQKKIVSSILPFDENKEKNIRFSDRTVNEIVRATSELAKAKTGALIIMEKDIVLSEYERTGITVDSVISSQLLINIFEHNTPLHDGAVIVRGDRIVAATCYLPLSDNMGLSKELGTRHRAAVGISEVSDSLTVIVSEETGMISVAVAGKLMRNVDGDLLRQKLNDFQGKPSEEKTKKLFWRKKGGDEA